MTEKLRDRIRMADIAPMRHKPRPTVVERALPSGLGSSVQAFEQLLASPIETSDGVAVLELAHRLRLRGFGVDAVVTLQLAQEPDHLTVDVTLAEAADGTSMVRLATRGACRDGFDSAAAVLHDITRALEVTCRAADAVLDATVTSPP
jgi:hypothetical protein